VIPANSRTQKTVVDKKSEKLERTIKALKYQSKK